jgi:hypothetical protein
MIYTILMNITMSLYTALWSMPESWLISLQVILGDFLFTNATGLTAGTLSLSIIPALPFGASDPTIPWHNTHSLSKGIEALNRMYNSLKDDDPLKAFLTKHCLHLLKPLQGHTGISVTNTEPAVLQQLPNTVQLAPQFTTAQFANLPGTVGIYVFFLAGENVITQCGSTIRFINRMTNHYREAAKGNFIFGTNAIHDYFWTPVAYTPDYVSLFNADNTMTDEQEVILNAFTEQEVRSLEQAYTTWAKPSNYKGIAVHTSHNNWQPGNTKGKTDGKRITWSTQDGKVYTRDSISSGAQELGFSTQYLKGMVQSGNPFVYTDKYGTVEIEMEGIVVTNVDPLRYGTPANTLVDTTSLEPNKYYLYDKDMNQLPYGSFSTVADTNIAMGLQPTYSGTSLWFNYMHTVFAVALGMEVYVVKGLSTASIPVVALCVETGVSVDYPSITAALKEIAPKNRGGYPILKAMVLGNSIKGTDNTYLLSFQDSNHLVFSTKAYNAHKKTSHKIPVPYGLKERLYR